MLKLLLLLMFGYYYLASSSGINLDGLHKIDQVSCQNEKNRFNKLVFQWCWIFFMPATSKAAVNVGVSQWQK